ncbi:acyl-CoA-binding domain-containing protein 6 isoform X4 [Hypanus sabinus]|uniref:acyl-CoA-binding domain-containing protein 6 isoform X4 n=1 Tax=Hypanus sabinus TaxID=79690 RepID=UPI0028C4C6DF|nr:acyl-CoA-binding domain-containing protein 6 isoform X4 [Hypanus sabinus]
MAAAGGGGEERPRAAVGEPEEGEEEDCGCSGSALRAEFEEAAEHVIKLAHVANREKLLYLYGRFKQAKFGKCNIPKPGFFDFEGRQKWEAWKELGDMTAQQAMEEYVAAVKELDPEWQTKDLSKESGLKVRFGGPVVSSLYQEETIREEDKTIFDHCRENNIDHVLKALSNNVDVNLKDEEGRALLHWACDRGHKELVGMLLQQKAEINSQDSEGQTALHYASACEFAEIVELLLNSGADPTIQDGEGCLPEEVTDSKDISQMLRQYASSKG